MLEEDVCFVEIATGHRPVLTGRGKLLFFESVVGLRGCLVGPGVLTYSLVGTWSGYGTFRRSLECGMVNGSMDQRRVMGR